jgi:hypothetical protein
MDVLGILGRCFIVSKSDYPTNNALDIRNMSLEEAVRRRSMTLSCTSISGLRLVCRHDNIYRVYLCV